jgi:spoIIIJ-associated protein
MTETREFNAATVEEALEQAAADLGVSAKELSYEVVDAGSAGFLGMGARDARIVVSVQERTEPSPDDEEPEAPAPSEQIHDLSEVFRESEAEEDVPAPPELLDEIQGLVESVVDAMGLAARVDVYDAGGFVAVDVASDSTALFIGQKGETIDALQFLVNAATYRRHPYVKRIILDAEGYRQRRVEAIQGIAHRTARRAVRERRTMELPPMNPSERRIVHLYLRDDPNVTTHSEGTGENRRVRIFPT